MVIIINTKTIYYIMSNITNRNLGILVSGTTSPTPWIDIVDERSVESAKKCLETLTSRLEEAGLTASEGRLHLFEVACELGTCFYDGFTYSLGDQSMVYISLDGRKILHLQSVRTEGLEEHGNQELQERVDQAVLGGLGDLLKLFEVKEDPLDGLLYLAHPLNLSSHYYDRMCVYPDGEGPFPRAIRSALHSLGFLDMNEGNATLRLFGHDHVRLHQEGDSRHIKHLRECLKERIVRGDDFKDIASNFQYYDFKRIHAYDKID